MSIDLKALGFTQEELQERVIERIANSVLTETAFNFDGEYEFQKESEFKRSLDTLVKERIDTKINELAERFVLPNVSEYIETLTLQKTNRWGEKTGEPITFIEYLTQRAKDYMQEHVNYEGKTKEESGGYSWNGKQTRITHLIEKHLHYSIEKAMKDALSVATGEIAKGIHETARLKLNEIAASLKVQTTIK